MAGDGLLNNDIRRARGDTDGDCHLHWRGCVLFLLLLLEGLLFCFDGCFIFVTIAKAVEHAAADFEPINLRIITIAGDIVAELKLD